MSSGRALPSVMRCSVSGWIPIKPLEVFENAILWNWSCRDSNRRSNAARTTVHRQPAENSAGGAQGPFTAGLYQNGRTDPARSSATGAGDPRISEPGHGTADGELNSRDFPRI